MQRGSAPPAKDARETALARRFEAYAETMNYGSPRGRGLTWNNARQNGRIGNFLSHVQAIHLPGTGASLRTHGGNSRVSTQSKANGSKKMITLARIPSRPRKVGE